MIAIIDYDAGNMHSVSNALSYLGAESHIVSDPDSILTADHIILPGVGSFGHAMQSLQDRNLIQTIHEAIRRNIPFLGICLGMQVLFEQSEESPGIAGLSVFSGDCVRFHESSDAKIPQIGWNQIQITNDSRLLAGIPDGSDVYFVHSYYIRSTDSDIVTARCQYTDLADVVVEHGNLFGTQFHPEKSGDVGLKILSNFLKVTTC